MNQPFNPADPEDAVSEMFRRQVTDIALAAYKVAIYRDLNPQQQLECFVAGTLTGLIGVCLASIQPAGADAMMDYLAQCLPMARKIAESVQDDNGHSVINAHDETSDASLLPARSGGE